MIQKEEMKQHRTFKTGSEKNKIRKFVNLI